MQPLDSNVVRRFAEEFCFGRRGFTLEAIPRWFGEYQTGMPTTGMYPGQPLKVDLFCDCVARLSPENQLVALSDLCDDPPESKHSMPSEQARRELLSLLGQADGNTPLGLDLARISLGGVRSQWYAAANRVASAPAAAITAARTLLESTCKTIVADLGERPDTSGDLMRLYGQARRAVGLEAGRGVDQTVHKILNGFSQAVEGIAALSNRAGDRHGLVGGQRLDDVEFSGVAVHAAGTVALFLARAYKMYRLGRARGAGS